MTALEEAESQRTGFAAAITAYTIWGILPLYLKAVGFADAREVLAMRILWSVPAAIAALYATGGVRQLAPALQPRMLGMLAASALFIFGNWAIFVWAVSVGRVIETALAYFLAPLVNVGFGVVLFGERLRQAQLAALVLAVIGVAVQAVAIGRVPVVSLVLCATWCCYGLVRKQAPVASAAGFLIETLWLSPVAIAILVWTAAAPGLAFSQSAGGALLLALSGPLTAIPLMLFAIGARRLPFTIIGLLQYIPPSLAMLIGLAYGESLSPLRAAGFACIWAGLVLYTWDVLRRERAA